MAGETGAGSVPLNFALGPYQVRREIGRGGVGAVYEAYDPGLRRRLALKIVLEGEVQPVVLKRLRREAEIAARLEHPNIVRVHDVGTARHPSGHTIHYLAMDLVEGRTYGAVLKDKSASRPEKMRIYEEVVRAVAHAHSKGVVHRDLKPSNVLVDREGRVLLTDFGLARAREFHSRLTGSQEVMGTPQYMAPEQIDGRRSQVSERADVYALGVMLYEVLTGRTPFAGETATALFRRVLFEDPEPPSRVAAGVEHDLELICLRALAKERHRRYADAAAFLADLERFRRSEPVLARPASLLYRIRRTMSRWSGFLALGSGVLAVVAVALVIVLRPGPGQTAREEERRRSRLQETLRPVETAVRRARLAFYVRDGDIRRTLDDLERQLEDLERRAVDPELARRPELWSLLGRGWYFAGDDRRAESALLRARELAPDEGWVNYYVGRLYLDRALLARFAMDQTDPEGDERRSQELIAKGKVLIDRAMGLWQGAKEIDRAVAQAFLILGERDYERIKSHLDESCERFERSAGAEELWLLQGWISRKGTKIPAYDRALEIRPHYAIAYFERANELMNSGQGERALEDFGAALRINPRLAIAWMNRAVLRYRLKDLKGALEDCEEALKILPDMPEAYFQRGTILSDQGKHEEALREYSRAIDLRRDFPMALYNRGLAKRRLKDTPGAIEDYSEAIRLKPDYADAFNNRGVAKWGFYNDIEGALADFSSAIRSNPRHFSAYKNRGLLRLQRKDSAGAARDFMDALNGAPADWKDRAELERILDQLRTP